MAESALCGPSNALQGLQKHATIDRTLQQDRLAARHPSSQGFRSSAGPNAGVLDPEFEAFQAASAPPLELQPHFAQPPHLRSTHIPDWASDFQHLNISQQPSPVNRPQYRPHASIQGAVAGVWHQEFLQAQNNVQHDPMQNPGMQRGFGGIGMAGFGMQGASVYGGGMNMELGGSEAHAQHYVPQQGDEIYDDAAFEQAFETANLEFAQQEDLESGRELLGEEGPSAIDGRNSSVEVEAETEQKRQGEPGEEDSDELARTAGRLLDSVKDNQSQKFQESTFLSLMRRIRDREVRVEGDKMVEVGNIPSAIAVDHL
ncbi:hypothetical protein GP486_004510 [Trichoglossum hirsutum]|uniref:Peroxin 20 n=1 Tax=Trichoglossum hirsutum TaxID=265104 RepID=A0A9P8RPL2_9PEZI|nr:hypothetical protein GP486_004510 [Trichoglossum hirsutum]